MSDALKKFLDHELAELRRNKISTSALGACLLVLLVFWLVDDTSEPEEVSLNESAADKPVTKDLPAKPLPVTKTPDGVTLVLGANADPLTIADPFAGNEKPKPPPTPKPAVKLPPIAIQPPPITPPPAPQEKILLAGTAISGERKTAMFLRGKDTLFLTIDEEIAGRRIVDINPDFVTFADGGRVFVQKELN